MKSISYLLAITSAAVFIPSAVFAAPVERRASPDSVKTEPVCFMQIGNGRIVDLTAMCSSSSNSRNPSAPSAPEEVDTELIKTQLEALTRSRQSNAGLINRAMEAGMNLSR